MSQQVPDSDQKPTIYIKDGRVYCLQQWKPKPDTGGTRVLHILRPEAGGPLEGAYLDPATGQEVRTSGASVAEVLPMLAPGWQKSYQRLFDLEQATELEICAAGFTDYPCEHVPDSRLY